MYTNESDVWGRENWYAIQSKPSREDEAAGNIRRLGLPVFLPKMRREKLQFGRRRVNVKPLFPGYLFARFCLSPYLHAIRYARGVNRVVSTGELPVPLSDEVISTIESRIGKDGFVEVTPTPFARGQEVVISEGPLQGLVGVFEGDLSDRERASILLRTVEYHARVLIEKSRLMPVTAIDIS